MKRRIKVKIGNGEKMFLWKENWHPFGPLMESYGHCIIYDARLGMNYKVKSIIEGDDWKWPLVNIIHLIEMRSLINFQTNEDKDKIVWLSNKDDVFSINSTWNKLRRKKKEVKWHSLVWHKNYFLRHSLILWMAMKKRLPTKDKLFRYNIT